MFPVTPRSSAIAVLLLAASTGSAAAGDSVVLRWNTMVLEAVQHSTLPPPAVARALAIVHTCIYDAWAAYDRVAAGVHYHAETGGGEADRARAVSYAAYHALIDLFPGQAASFDALMAELAYDPHDHTLHANLVGVHAAQAGLDARAHDGSNQHGGYADETGYTPINGVDVIADPNRWQPLRTPDGGVQSFVLPQWGHVTPFALDSPDQFRPPPPVPFPHGLYRKQAIEILHSSARLTDRQKIIAEYWEDGPGTVTPPGHWCRIAAFVSRRDGHTLGQDVILFFALANALMDASIAVWEAKVHYDYVRPVTAIRFVFAGQPIRAWAGPYQGTRLIPAETWRSYIPTPPFADYVSGHSAFSAAGAEILQWFTGSDDYGAQVTVPAGASAVEPGLVPRRDVTLSWRTFSEAADEAARAMGRQIGAIVWRRVLTHVRSQGRF